MNKWMLTLLGFVCSIHLCIAQAPNAFNYQAVVRDAEGEILINQAVGMQFSILQGNIGGSAVYVETHNLSTNTFGLVTLMIGNGTTVSGDFSAINWSKGPYFVKVGLDPTGGTSYNTIMGTTQLLSVPYALHSNTTNRVSSPWYIGKDTLGGIVFYIYKGSDGLEHGLIVNKTESSPLAWQAIADMSLTNASKTWDGAFNTAQMTNSPAADYVHSLSDGGFTDWYIPSIDELRILWQNLFLVNKALDIGAHTLISSFSNYWSSTEVTYQAAWAYGAHNDFSPITGIVGNFANSTEFNNKNELNTVRGIRVF